MTPSLRRSNHRSIRNALLVCVIGASLFAGPAVSAATDDTKAATQRIDEDVNQIELHQARDRTFTLKQNCTPGEWGLVCEMVTAVKDAEGHIRKIAVWTEGAKLVSSPPDPLGWISSTSPPSIAKRSIWESFYDAKGNPIFVWGRLEGGRFVGWMREYALYIQDGKRLDGRVAEGSIGHYNDADNSKDAAAIASAREKLQDVTQELSQQGH